MTTCLDRLQHWLRKQHVAYSIQHHRQAYSVLEVAQEVHERADHVAEVIAAQVDGRLVMLVVPEPAQVDFKHVAKLLAANKARAANESECASRFPDCEPGALPPFGSLYNLPTYVDEALTHTRKLVFLAGTHRDTLKLATEDYLRLAQPIIGRLTRAVAPIAT
jgi:Ala-tRNA(Pro) deacylase